MLIEYEFQHEMKLGRWWLTYKIRMIDAIVIVNSIFFYFIEESWKYHYVYFELYSIGKRIYMQRGTCVEYCRWLYNNMSDHLLTAFQMISLD